MKSASAEELDQLAMLASFDLSRPDNRVEYDVWLTSSNDRALDFMQDFAKVDKKFGDSVLMTPRYKTWACPDCDLKAKSEHCFADGAYCAMDTHHAQLTGRDILLEDLRQMCIYKHFYGDEDNRKAFWDYIKSVHQQCYGSVNEDCSRLAHKDNGLDFADTQRCVDQSFTNFKGGAHDYKVASASFNNTLLDEARAYQAKYQPTTFPGVVINNQTFRGQLEVEAVLNAICAGFEDPPRMCSKYLGTNDINNPDLLFMREKRHTFGRVVGLCFAIVLSVILILCCYRRHAKREMKVQMN